MSYGDFDPNFPEFVVEGGHFFYSSDNLRLPNLEFKPEDFRLQVEFVDTHGTPEELLKGDGADKVVTLQDAVE